jgi:hypothetical protein
LEGVFVGVVALFLFLAFHFSDELADIAAKHGKDKSHSTFIFEMSKKFNNTLMLN